ncbi:hypothetical protein ETF27_02875 [Prevotella brunnea]|uniref:Uncharacterized protein n=1 Tax=Prevotella brunnea TaxID=2508867 RepID=A0A5C8GPA4_9BACT|nr:hypothetical protein [Prevotella brunnea]TXJ62814.1 hypothetical protein ETF27_02875 [Prevotella brunnea]
MKTTQRNEEEIDDAPEKYNRFDKKVRTFQRKSTIFLMKKYVLFSEVLPSFCKALIIKQLQKAYFHSKNNRIFTARNRKNSNNRPHISPLKRPVEAPKKQKQ